MSYDFSPFAAMHRLFAFCVLVLLFYGITTMYSLSYIANNNFTKGHFAMHCGYLVGALLFFLLVLQVPLQWWREHVSWIVSVALVLCFAALLFSPAGGASRWIGLFGFSLQPSEFLKFAALLTYASWGRLVVQSGAMNSTRLPQVSLPLTPFAMFIVITVVVLVAQKDLGTIVLLGITALLTLVLAGMAWRYILTAGLGVLLLIALLIWVEPYRVDRLMVFIDPFADPYGAGYAQLQSLMAYQHGGWFGAGAGGSLQKELLPEAHNDFILAVLVEEHGLVGFFVVCGIYLILACQALGIAMDANERGELFGAFYAFMFAALLMTQVSISVGGSMAVLPSKGLTLPLISYGGSSIWAMALMFAVLLRINYENKRDDMHDGSGAMERKE